MILQKPFHQYTVDTRGFHKLGLDKKEVIMAAEALFDVKYFSDYRYWKADEYPFLARNGITGNLSGGVYATSHGERQYTSLVDVLETIKYEERQIIEKGEFSFLDVFCKGEVQDFLKLKN